MYRLLIGLVVGFLWVPTAFAADAGEVSVPLEGEQTQSLEAREQALRSGLGIVVRRLTGRDQVADLPGVAAVLEDPGKWLLRYAYEGGEPPRLKAVFDDRALARHLSDQGAPVWSGTQPPVLVWLVAEGAGRGRMVAADEPLAKRLTKAAARRGVSLKMPEWDAEDREAVTVADIRGRFDTPLLQASKRYQTALVATAVLYDAARGGPTTLNWRLLNHGETLAKSRDRAPDTDAALEQLVTVLADPVAERYSVGVEGDRDQSLAPIGGALVDKSNWITVRGIKGLRTWQRLHEALSNLGPTRSVALRVASGNRVQFEVDFAGGQSQLVRSVGGIKGLHECQDTATASPTFCYR